MSKEKKAKKGFGKAAIIIACVLLVLLVAANIGANYFSRLLDVYVGLGEATITTKEGAENWDTEYYTLDSQTAEDADKVAKDVTLRIAQEGIVLMKNENGALRDDPQVDAILWMAYPGSRGTVALANILTGAVNPSGHTVDTWVVDMTADPTFPNTSAVKYENVSKSNALADSYVVEYEEGIYFGYRYYETVAADGGSFTVEGQSGKSYEDAVAYPFGYGLSYTSFEQSIKSAKAVNGNIELVVTVKNTGDVAGKDVVQVYFHAPYTVGGVEKSDTVLAAFEKTEELQPGASAEYTISFPIENMASYDYLTERCYHRHHRKRLRGRAPLDGRPPAHLEG